MPVYQRHRDTRLGEGLRGRQTYAGARTGNECNFFSKDKFISDSSFTLCIPVSYGASMSAFSAMLIFVSYP
jgi:hypothetical protein